MPPATQQPPTPLRGGRPVTIEVSAESTVLITSEQPNAIIALASFDRIEPLSRLSMYTTQSMNHTWQVGGGHALWDTECRVAWRLEAASGGLYAGGGACIGLFTGTTGPEEPTCLDILAEHLAGMSLDERHRGPDSYLDLFATATYASDGSWRVRASGRAGDSIELRATYDQHLVLLACDHTSGSRSDPEAIQATLRVSPGVVTPLAEDDHEHPTARAERASYVR